MQGKPLLAASIGLAVADVMVLCPQTSFLVKHEGGWNALVICLGAWEDGETGSRGRVIGVAMRQYSGKGLNTVNSTRSVMTRCSTRSDGIFFYYRNNTHPMSKPRVLGK